MARPQKDGLDYFSHDVHASSDAKIETLLLLYGAKGYSFYFIHLEYIYRNSDLEFDISDAETREVICQKLKISADEYNQILETSLKKNCFDKKHYEETKKLTSDGIKKRAKVVVDKRLKMREKYENKQLEVSDSETMEEIGNSAPKEKKRKGKERKENIYTDVFESFYSEYPRPHSKADTFRSWNKRLKEGYTVEQLIESARNYKQATIQTDIKFKNSSNNFLGEKAIFKDYLTAPQQQQTQPQTTGSWGKIESAPPEFRR